VDFYDSTIRVMQYAPKTTFAALTVFAANFFKNCQHFQSIKTTAYFVYDCIIMCIKIGWTCSQISTLRLIFGKNCQIKIGIGLAGKFVRHIPYYAQHFRTTCSQNTTLRLIFMKSSYFYMRIYYEENSHCILYV